MIDQSRIHLYKGDFMEFGKLVEILLRMQKKVLSGIMVNG